MSHGRLTPGFWAQLLDYASLAIRQGRLSHARFYINQARLYDAPRLP
jgi:hypothetical protein